MRISQISQKWVPVDKSEELQTIFNLQAELQYSHSNKCIPDIYKFVPLMGNHMPLQGATMTSF